MCHPAGRYPHELSPNGCQIVGQPSVTGLNMAAERVGEGVAWFLGFFFLSVNTSDDKQL